MLLRLAKTSVLVLLLVAATVLWGAAQALAQPGPKFPGGPPKAPKGPVGPGAGGPAVFTPKSGGPAVFTPKSGGPAQLPVQKPKGPGGVPVKSWADLGRLALDVAVDLLSGNQAHLLSGNKTDLLSGNSPKLLSEISPELLSRNEVELLSGNKPELLSRNETELLSGNKTDLLSGNKPKLLNGNRVSILSGNKLEIRIENSGNNNGNHGPSMIGPPPGVKPMPGAGAAGPLSSLRAANAAAAAGVPVRPRAAAPSERFKQLDLNGDGVISLEEFLRATAR
jgi:hypothetical protein